MTDSHITVYCDGGSRGNPGPAAVGVVIEIYKRGLNNLRKSALSQRESAILKEYSKFLGEATNNEAEYQAVIFALKKIKQLIGKEKAKKLSVEIKSDSELLIKQLNAEYKIKEKNLVPFFIEIWNLKQDFKEIKFVQVPREENKRADLLANRELDSKATLF